jgi:hypothetical protein
MHISPLRLTERTHIPPHPRGAAQGKTTDEKVVDAVDRLSVAFGTEITKLVPGYVSTEVWRRAPALAFPRVPLAPCGCLRVSQ